MIGVIAQHVMKVLPEITKTFHNDTYLSVVYTGLIPLLTEAIKELDETYDHLITGAKNMNISLLHGDNKLSDFRYDGFHIDISTLMEEEEEIGNLHGDLLAKVTSLEDKIQELRKDMCTI